MDVTILVSLKAHEDCDIHSDSRLVLFLDVGDPSEHKNTTSGVSSRRNHLVHHVDREVSKLIHTPIAVLAEPLALP